MGKIPKKKIVFKGTPSSSLQKTTMGAHAPIKQKGRLTPPFPLSQQSAINIFLCYNMLYHLANRLVVNRDIDVFLYPLKSQLVQLTLS